MLARINQLRGEEGVPPLERHPGLDAAAQAHSVDMASHEELVHVSERTGDPGRRVREAGVGTLRVGENIARAENTRAAFGSILGSEAHRAQVLDAGFTHIGLASVSGPDGMYVTQVFASLAPPPAELPPPAVMDTPAEPEAEPAQVPPAPPAPVPTPTNPNAVPAAPGAPGAGPGPQIQQGPQQPGTQAGPPRQVRPQPTIPTMRMPAGRRRVAGYWVFHGQRWWYFPVPPRARPGMLLRPDPRVQGPPPGHGRYQNRRPPIRPTQPPPPVQYQTPNQPNQPPPQQAPPPNGQRPIYWY